MSDDQGRTLRLHGPADVGRLDPVCACHPPAGQLTRLFARQLFGYRQAGEAGSWQSISPVPDIATDIPSTYNAGLGASHRSYIVHLRPDVLWDTVPPRPVTAYDVVRGFKRLANPVRRSPVLSYFTSAIRGMADYCEAYAAAVPADGATAAELAAFQNGHEIPGVFALDAQTLVVELTRPALDAVSILALPCVSPAPAEYDAFLPDSDELCRSIRSTGPYRLAGYQPGVRIRLERNPVWHQETDLVRQQQPAAVEITIGSRPWPGPGADLPWGPSPAPRPVEGLGLGLDYLALNFRRPAMAEQQARLGVRDAIGTAGGIVPPGNDARQDIAATRGRGASAAGISALRGLEVIAAHLDTDTRSIRCYADLAAAGVTVRRRALSSGDYDEFLRQGRWDIAALTRFPDWFHANWRVFVQPLLQSGSPGNYGDYSSPRVDKLIDEALGAMAEAGHGRDAWQAAEREALADVAIIPVRYRQPAVPGPVGADVCQAPLLPALGGYDLSAVRLRQEK